MNLKLLKNQFAYIFTLSVKSAHFKVKKTRRKITPIILTLH